MARQAGGTYAAIAKDRWSTLTTGIEGPTAEETLSELLEGWMASTRELLARMVHGIASEADYSALCAAEDRVMRSLEAEALALVETVETAREAVAA